MIRMPSYISVPIETDAQDLFDIGVGVMETRIPGWQPNEAQQDVILLTAIAEMVAEAMDVGSDVPVSIYRDLGANLLGIPPIDDNSAQCQSTWVLADTAGHTIPRDTVVILTSTSGEDIPFLVAADVVVPFGSSSTSAGGVLLIADEESGAAGNGCSGTGELVDAISWVSTITLTTTSSGGTDAEEDQDYLNRLTEELQLMAPRPITSRDFAVRAKRTAGVERATAIDLYNLDTATAGVEKAVTVIVTDALGNALSAGIKNTCKADLQAQREVNFLVFVGDPTYTTVNVTFTAVAHPNWDLADVELRAEAAVTDFLRPYNWGLPPTGEVNDWLNQQVLRNQDLMTVLNQVMGLSHVTALTFQLGAGANDGTDKTFTGVAPLPLVGTINGTVVSS